MNTKLLLAASAAFMAVLGLAATFAPQEIAARAGVPAASALAHLAVQTAGALYLGFAANNWMVKHIAMGGIYGRPLALGNLLHFSVAAIAMAKAIAGGHRDAVLIAVALIYAAFAVAFTLVVFGPPTKK